MMSTIPEDSVLRRHYLAAIARQQTAGNASSSPQSARAGTAAQPPVKPSHGMLGFFKRLLGR